MKRAWDLGLESQVCCYGKKSGGHAWGDLVLIFVYCIIAYNKGNIELFAWIVIMLMNSQGC